MASAAGATAPAPGRVHAVLWDLGGVLLDWDPRHLYRKIFGPDSQAMERFLATVCSPEWHARQDLDVGIEEACAEREAMFPEHAALIRAWAERNEEMVAGPIEESVQLLGELKQAGVPCYALSNMEKESWARRLASYDFLSWFDGHFISAVEGVMKPDPAFFQRALERFDLRPHDALFIDDRQENVRSAASVGVPGLHFTGAGRLRLDLVALGLLAG